MARKAPKPTKVSKHDYGNQPKCEPSPAEIQAACEEIQSEWGPHEFARRSGKSRVSAIGSVRLWVAEPTAAPVFDPGQ